MRKSIFVRYFTVITSIILICLTILGTLLISFAAQYWVNDKQEMLTRNAKDMADILGELALKNQAQIQWNPQTKRYSLFFEEGFIPESMNAAILVMASASNSDVRIISPAGRFSCLPPQTTKWTRMRCFIKQFPPTWLRSPLPVPPTPWVA